jgi:hypothetical protein
MENKKDILNNMEDEYKVVKELVETGGVTCLIYEAHKNNLFLMHNGEKFISEEKHKAILKEALQIIHSIAYNPDSSIARLTAMDYLMKSASKGQKV